MYNYNHLYYFYVTASAGSVTSASEYLHISQPALSGQLKVLEQSLQVKLFKKVGRGIVLTNQGKTIFETCKEMFSLSEQLTEIISKKCPIDRREIHIAHTGEIEEHYLNKAIKLYFCNKEAHQWPIIHLAKTPFTKIIEQLKFKEIDLALVNAPYSEEGALGCLDFSTPIVIAISTTSHFDHKKIDQLDFLNDQKSTWVSVQTESFFDTLINSINQKNKQKGKRTIFTNSIHFAKKMVMNNIGASFFPLDYIKEEVKSENLKILEPSPILENYRVQALIPRQSHPDHLLQNLISCLEATQTSEH